MRIVVSAEGFVEAAEGVGWDTWPSGGEEVGERPVLLRGARSELRKAESWDQTAAMHQYGPSAQFSSPQHYKPPQDTLLSHFNFLHYTQILHCLKNQ